MSTLVDRIRAALEAKNGLSADVMVPLASAYEREVAKVNQRLSEAVGLLRKGLRSEAIQRASLTPNAIDAAANLDFPEIGEWIEILQFLDVPVPPLVDQDAAIQLNEAIVETQPLEDLLNRHRRLAIAKAPLSWRLKVLRRIAKVDSMNPVWEEDLESWEQVRLKQIPAELNEAIRTEDAKAVAAIYDELANQSWRIGPSSQLIQKAKNATEKFVYDEQMEELRRLGPQLYDAFGEFNEPLARSIRDRWREVVSDLTQPVDVEIQEQAAPALAWLDELDREAVIAEQRAFAIGKLQSALHEGSDINSLHRTYQQASRFDEPVPFELEQQFKVAVAEHELRSRRKTQAILTSIVAATLIVAAFITFQQWRSVENERVDSAAAQMGSLLDEGKWTEAQQFFEQLQATSPKIASTPAIASLASRLNGELAREQERSTEFQNYLAEADNEDAAKIDLASLARAESLAISESEKAAAYQIRRRRTQWERDLQAEHSKAVLDRLSAFRGELDQIESGSPSLESLQAITLLLDKIDQLATEYPKHSSSAASQMQLVKTRGASMRDAMRTRTREMRDRSVAIDRVMKAESLATYADSLKAFAKDVPSSAMSKEFEQVSDERELWASGLRANNLMTQLSAALVGRISSEEASDILATYQQISSSIEKNPMVEAIPDFATRMAEVANREKLLDEFFQNLALQTVSELVTFEVPTEEDPSSRNRYFVYYSHFDRFRERFLSTGRVGIEVVVNESSAVSNQGFVGPLDVIPEPRDTVRWLLNKNLDSRDDFLADWNGSFLRAAAELRSRPQLDGLVKEMLLLQLLRGGSNGSEFLRLRLSDAIRLLDRRSEQRRRWYVPKPLDSSLDATVEQLVVPAMSKAYMERDKEWDSFKKLSERRYQWIGILLRQESGAITTHIKEQPSKSGELFVIRPAVADPSKVDFAKVGDWIDNHVVIGSSQRDLVAGRPLFYLPSFDET